MINRIYIHAPVLLNLLNVLGESGRPSILPLFRNMFNVISQGLHRLEKYLNLEGLLEKSLNIKSALKSTGNSLKGFEKSLNSTIFFWSQHCW